MKEFHVYANSESINLVIKNSIWYVIQHKRTTQTSYKNPVGVCLATCLHHFTVVTKAPCFMWMVCQFLAFVQLSYTNNRQSRLSPNWQRRDIMYLIKVKVTLEQATKAQRGSRGIPVMTAVLVSHRCLPLYWLLGVALLSQCYPTYRDTTKNKLLTTLTSSSGFSNLSAATSIYLLYIV